MAAKLPQYVCSKCLRGFPRWPGSSCTNSKCGVYCTAIVSLVEAREMGLALPAPWTAPPSKVSRQRWPTGLRALDRILSHEGGVVPGKSALFAAVPGGGKTTLWLAALGHIARRRPATYMSAEQDVEALRTLAERLDVHDRAKLRLMACRSIDDVLAHIRQAKPDIIVIDSATELAKHSGKSVFSVVEALHELAAANKVAIIIISHINAEGLVRGGPALAHKTDAVFMLMGEPKKSTMRELVAEKNRLGPTEITTSIKMTAAHGFVDVDARAEISHKLPVGAALAVIGTDVLEVQAMLTPRTGERRVHININGAKSSRLQEVVGVMEADGLPLADRNVIVRVTESEHTTSKDLDAAIVAAILSALTKVALPPGTALCGEVTFSGELRGEQPEDEAKRLKLRLLGKPGKSIIRSLVQECGDAMFEEIRAKKAAAQPDAPANDAE